MPDIVQMKNKIMENLNAVMPQLIEINDYIHANPEMGNQEFEAVKRLTGILNQHGFSVRQGVADLETAFIAELKGFSPGFTVAFVAEYDALPEVGHGCGHNIIGTSAVGAALVIAPLMKELGGIVKVIGTPAEDTTFEKVQMIAKGVFADIDFAMQCHPNDRTMTGSKFKALHHVDFNFYGRSSHASRAPEKGISALDAVLQTFMAIEYLKEHVKKDVSIAGIIPSGGTVPNSIPDFASARFILRSNDSQVLKEVAERTYNCARGAALATGAKLEIQENVWLDNHLCIPAFDQLFLNNVLTLNPPQVLPQENMASSDFCNVSTVLPASRLDIAFVPVGTSTHSQEFADGGNTQEAHKAIKMSSYAMAATALDLLTNTEVANKIKEEHRSLMRT